MLVSSVTETVVAAMVGEATNPKLDNAVATSPDCWTTGAALKNPNFWVVAVPILVPVEDPTTMLAASFKVIVPVVKEARVPAPAWVMLKLAPEISLPDPELVMVKTSPVAEA